MTWEPTSATSPENLYAIVVATRNGGERTEFLMVRHRERGWELPGGKLEDNEGPVHCALREFREETGHLLSSPKYVMKLQKPDGTCHVFTGNLGARVNDVRADEAIEAMDWYSRLPPLEDLAFPDDPYDELGAALGIDFGHAS